MSEAASTAAKKPEPKGHASVSFDDFRRLAQDGSLDKYQKIHARTADRAGREHIIYEDILGKLPVLNERGKRFLDIGPGCTDLPLMLLDLCEKQGHSVVLNDSREMLALLPDKPFAEKFDGRFPNQCRPLIERLKGKVDAIVCYSVLHCVVPGGDVFDFFDSALALLAEGGMMLIGDIPNFSKLRRFLASENGIVYHKAFMKTDQPPEVHFNTLEPGAIDDALLTGLMLRARAAGFDAYLLPQDPRLPMSNRREDMVIYRP
jgi:hypothetical protein